MRSELWVLSRGKPPFLTSNFINLNASSEVERLLLCTLNLLLWLSSYES